MNQDAQIYVAGHQGLVGSALVRRLRAHGHGKIIARSHQELDLTDHRQVQEFFAQERPEYVFLAAAKVGGIFANSTYPAEFIEQNLRIQTNVIHEAYQHRVKRLLFLGSSCIYPRLARQPIKEDSLLSGPLEATNRAYAVAKIAGIEMCSAYNRQYGTRYLAAMPTNLYGPGDRYDRQDSHVIPALLLKLHEGKVSGADQVTLWGTGTPRREFLCSDDAAEACVFLMNLPDQQFHGLIGNEDLRPVVNIGCGKDVIVRELAELIAGIVEFKGKLVFDTSKPDGTPKKLLDVGRLTALGWKPSIRLREGLVKTYQDFLDRPRPTPRAESASLHGN
jgi:GDP-L-fucose synthase